MPISHHSIQLFEAAGTECIHTCQELDDNFGSSNRAAIQTLLRDLSDASGELPSTYWLTGVKRSTRRAYGGDAEIWVGTHAGQEVAVRDFWFPSEMSPEKLQKVSHSSFSVSVLRDGY